MEKGHLTTTQAAKLLSVSSDTVLKWVKAGKIESYRTPGGHCRIPSRAISKLLPSVKVDAEPVPTSEVSSKYCWQYNSDENGVTAECERCVVYRSKALRCYELKDLPQGAGFLKLHCESTCEECEYFQLVRGTGTNILVISRDERLKSRLRKECAHADRELRLEFVGGEYECAVLIEKFRPDYVVIDGSMGIRRTREICTNISNDDRVLFTRIVITSESRHDEDFCDRELFGWLRKPFSLVQLTDYVVKP